MALHDWGNRRDWDGLHTFWMTEIARQSRADLPAGYRAVIGTSPLLTIGEDLVRPDVAVSAEASHPDSGAAASGEYVEVAVATLDEEELTIQISQAGRLVAVIELISPRNKDRPAARDKYVGRYLNYLQGGVHLLLVDVHRAPGGFGFAGAIAGRLGTELPGGPAPSAVAYRVGPTAATGGRLLAVWHKSLAVGEPLPPMPVPIGTLSEVAVDLDGTYSRAAADSYVE